MRTLNVLSIILIAAALASCALQSTSPEKAESSENQISVAKDGNFLNANGKPQFLLGPAISNYKFIGPLTSKKKPHIAPEMEWIYKEFPDHSRMERMGFSTVCLQPSILWIRSLSPSYSTFFSENQDMDLRRVMSKYFSSAKDKWWVVMFTRYGLSKLRGKFIHDIKMPIYVDTHTGLGHTYKYKNKELETFLGEAAFFHGDGKSGFELTYSLGVPEGRAVYKKMWRYSAEEIKNNGGEALCYELLNEPKYRDPSPVNRALFANWLKDKYQNVAAMNATWRSQYKRFHDAAFGFSDLYARECPGLAIDWAKFQQGLVVKLCHEGRETIREIDPNAKVCVQVHGADNIRRLWHNMNIYDISRATDVINSGTGGFCGVDAENTQDGTQAVIDTFSVGSRLKSSLLNSRVWMSLAKGKPIIDDENYTGRTYESLHARVWSNMIRGHNATYLFIWCGIDATPEGAKASPYQILSPYYFDPTGLTAINDCKNEIAEMADFFLPRANRPKAQAALLFSYPSIRYDEALGHWGRIGDEMETAAVALTFSRYPFDVVFEEQLKEPRRLDEYKALFACNVKNVYASTAPVLDQYVKNGGALIATLETMKLDEYGNPISHPLFDIELKDIAGKVGRLENLGVKASLNKKVIYPDSWRVVDRLDGDAAILKKPYGKGTLWFVATELPDYSLAALCQKSLNELGVSPIAQVLAENRDEMAPNVEVHKAKHDGMVAWYFMNCDSYPKIIRLKSEELKGARVINPFERVSVAVDDDMINLLLPSLTRTVVVSGPADKVTKRFGDYPRRDLREMKAERDKIIAQRSQRAPKARPGVTIDLKKFCNRGFDNQQNWPNDSAWFDDSNRYLTGVPWHTNVFDGVNCEIIRMDFNDNRVCIAMKSKHLPDGAAEVKGIPINEQVKSVSFFQAVTYGKNGEKAMTYRVHYSDGATIDIPIVVGENIGDWNIDKNNDATRKKLAWKNDKNLGFFRWEWINPTPQNAVSSIDILSANGASTPIVVGITAHLADKKLKTLRFDDWNLARNPNARKDGNTLELFKTQAIFISPDNKPLPIPKDKLNSAVIKYSVNTRPDKWGKPEKLKRQNLYLWGLRDGKLIETEHKALWDTGIFTQYIKPDADPSTWQDVAVPLKLLLPAQEGGTIENITRFGVRGINTPTLIRDLRIEYEE